MYRAPDIHNDPIIGSKLASWFHVPPSEHCKPDPKSSAVFDGVRLASRGYGSNRFPTHHQFGGA